MAAPSATARGTPGGIMIPDGMRTKVTLSLNTTIQIEEVEVKPFGFDNGEPIEQDSMWSGALQVVRAQQITKCTPCTVICKYDPAALDALRTLQGVERSGSNAQIITETFYDGSTRAWYGYVRGADPDSLAIGGKGKMTVTLQPTNWDPVNNAYAAPVMVSVAGS